MKRDLDTKGVGKRLQRFREVRGLTRTVLALKLGITEKDLENVEAGKGTLTEKHLETLRDTFAVDPAWLLGGQDEQS